MCVGVCVGSWRREGKGMGRLGGGGGRRGRRGPRCCLGGSTWRRAGHVPVSRARGRRGARARRGCQRRRCLGCLFERRQCVCGCVGARGRLLGAVAGGHCRLPALSPPTPTPRAPPPPLDPAGCHTHGLQASGARRGWTHDRAPNLREQHAPVVRRRSLPPSSSPPFAKKSQRNDQKINASRENRTLDLTLISLVGFDPRTQVRSARSAN